MARKLPWVTVAGIGLTATNVFSGVYPLYGLALTNGGPAWATWSFLVVGLMSIAVTLCLSELASAYPTSAGVHHWVYQLGSAKRRAYLSWMVGWFTIVSAVRKYTRDRCNHRSTPSLPAFSLPSSLRLFALTRHSPFFFSQS